MCSTARSMNGTDANPSVMSTWLAWPSTTPEQVKVSAAKKQATVDKARARKKRYIPTPIAEKRITSVAIQATRSGRITNSPTRG
jgi:hypothetical protein